MENDNVFKLSGHGNELVKLEKMYRKSFVIMNHIKRDYESIYYQCEKDGFFKDMAKEFDYFKEIIIDDVVVDFMFLTFREELVNKLILESYYVLSEYRDRFSLSDEFSLIPSDKQLLVLHNPCHDDILSFIGVDDTKFIDDRFIFVSQVNFFDVLPLEDAVTFKYKNYQQLKDRKKTSSSLLYDSKLCCFVDYNTIFEGDDSVNSISPATMRDIEKYDCLNARQSDLWLNDGTYFIKTKEILRNYILENDLEKKYPLDTFNIQEVDDELPELHLKKGKLLVLKDKKRPLNRLIKIIKKDYKDIYDECVKENFFDSLASKYDAIKEIIVDGKVVGLIFCSISRAFFSEKFFIESFYVLSDYRKDFLISYELREIEEKYGYMAYIHNPKRGDIELLLEEEKAHYIDNRFVYIGCSLFFDEVSAEDSLKVSIRSYEETLDADGGAPSVFYDMELCCAINFAQKFDESLWTPEYLEQLEEAGFSDEEEPDLISVANQEDVEKYDCINKRQNDPWIKEGIYFEETKKIFRDYLTNNDVNCIYSWEDLGLDH